MTSGVHCSDSHQLHSLESQVLHILHLLDESVENITTYACTNQKLRSYTVGCSWSILMSFD